MKSISVALLSLILLVSCGKGGLEEKKPEGLSFASPLKTNRALTKTENDLGLETCKLFYDKREFFETLEDNKHEFRFVGFEKKCGESQRSLGQFSTRLRVPSRGPIYLDSKFYRYMDEILSDRQGFLSHYCSDLLDGKASNIIKLVGGKKVQLEIKKVQNYIIIGTAWYYPDDSGVFKPYLIDKAAVHTAQTTRNRNLHGVLKERTQSRPCSDGSVKSYQQRLR